LESNLFVFIKYLSLVKLWNILLVVLSYGCSLLLKRPIVWGQPFFLHIETTNLCNLKCSECPTGKGILTRPIGLLAFHQFEQFFLPLKNKLIYLVLYFQGEPFINPDLLRMIELARKHRVYTMVSTNGHFLQDDEKLTKLILSGLGSLIVSIDGVTQETYQKYRQNGDLNQVLAGIRQLLILRRNLRVKFPKVYLQFLVMRYNEHEIAMVQQLANDLGVDRVLFKTAQIYDFEQAEAILPQNPAFRRYEQIEGSYRLKGRIHNRCLALWCDSVLTWDGKVLPCCFDKDAHHDMGSLDSRIKTQENSVPTPNEGIVGKTISRDQFLSIWHGHSYQKYRQQILRDRKSIAICQNCSAGVKIFVGNK